MNGIDFFVTEVSFEINDEYVITNADVKISVYYEIVEIPGEEEGEYTYAVADGATAYARMDYTIEQNVEEELENPYPAEDVLASSFKIVDEDGNELGNTLNIKKGVATYLYLADVLPDTAILDFVSVVATGDAIDNWQLFVDVDEDSYGNWAINIRSYTIGEHEIALSVNGIVKNITVIVEEEKPTSEPTPAVVEGFELPDFLKDIQDGIIKIQ